MFFFNLYVFFKIDFIISLYKPNKHTKWSIFCTLKSILAICWCNTLDILITNKNTCKLKKNIFFHYMIIPLGPFFRKFALFSLSAVQYSATDTFCISYRRASFFVLCAL